MAEWQPIETAPTDEVQDYILWNGQRVFVGWYDDDGWYDSTVPEHMAGPEEPQPTHWMPFPAPPLTAAYPQEARR